jgi:hypothetical protein
MAGTALAGSTVYQDVQRGAGPLQRVVIPPPLSNLKQASARGFLNTLARMRKQRFDGRCIARVADHKQHSQRAVDGIYIFRRPTVRLRLREVSPTHSHVRLLLRRPTCAAHLGGSVRIPARCNCTSRDPENAEYLLAVPSEA